MATFYDIKQNIFKLKASAFATPTAFPFGLGASGVHEVCETRHGDLPALLGFSLTAKAKRLGAILHVQQSTLGFTHGDVLRAGAASLQAQSRSILSVRARKETDALWAIEEGIKSAAVGLVIAEITDCDFTASRRLVLASSRYGVPVILLMPHTREGATAATARWRVRSRLSANNKFNPRGLGVARWHAVLERSRQAPHFAGRRFDMEWNDEALSLTMVPGLAANQIEARADEQSGGSEQAQLLQYG